jgi:hypothetical protein
MGATLHSDMVDFSQMVHIPAGEFVFGTSENEVPNDRIDLITSTNIYVDARYP